MVQKDILNKIRQLRRNKGLSQADMADALHIALKTYQNIEGGVTRIDIERLEHIGQVLGVKIGQLFAVDEDGFGVLSKFLDEEKELYHKIIGDKEAYIVQLEQNIRFYQEMLRKQIPEK